MSIQFIFGRANSGKTEYVLNKAYELYNNNNPFVIVVPEQYTHIAEKKLIDKIGSIVQGRAEVLSYDRIATRINGTYGSQKKHLNTIGKKLIFSEIISNTELFYYKNALKDSGFINVCADEISEFKKYNVTHTQLADIAKNTNDYSLSLKLRDISEIYSKYDNVISSEYSDSDDSLGILYDNLDKYLPYEGYTFIFDEFSSFNPQERNIILSLAKQCSMVYVTLCADISDKNSILFKPTLDVAKKISDECKTAAVNVFEPVNLLKTYYQNNEMKFLEENIYSYPYNVYEHNTNNIKLNIYNNSYSEISGLAAQIKNIVKCRGVRYKDINVVCADIESYSHIIKNVFKKYDIPYFIDEKTSVLKHSIISSVINILDVYLNNYSSEYVISFLKSGYIDIKRDALICADNFISSTNASKNIWLDDDKWKKTVDVYCDGDSKLCEVLNNIRTKYILPLALLHDNIKGRNTVKYICEKLYNYLIDTEFDVRITEYIEDFKVDNNKYLEKQYELVWKKLIEAMDTMALILGDRKISLSQYRKYLYISLQEQQIGIIPTSLDSVFIGDVKRSKTASSYYQFIIGVIDGVFPSVASNNSILSDSDKKIIESMGVSVSPDIHHKAMYERFLTYTVLSKASDTLILSYPVSDSGLNSVRPSFLVTIIKGIFRNLKVNSFINKSDELLLYNLNDSVEFFSNQIYKLVNGKEYDVRWKDLYKVYTDDLCANIDLVDKLVFGNNQIEKLDDVLTDKLFKDEFYSTISRLQRYNSCRYSYYLEYMLGLRKKDKFDPESTDVGTFVHACIEKTFLEINKMDKSITDVADDEMIKIAEPVFKECMPLLFRFNDELSEQNIFLFNTSKLKVVKALLDIKSHFVGSAFVPLGHEITFDDECVGCIELNLDNKKKLKLVGKIDRADSFENEDGVFIRVVDYKTGNKSFSFSDVFYGLDMQLIVYLNTLVKNTKNGHHAGALFFKLQNPIEEFSTHPDDDVLNNLKAQSGAMNGLVPSENHIINAYSSGSLVSCKNASLSQFSALSQYVEETLRKSGKDLSEGYIEINPYTKSSASPCMYCDFSGICKFDDGINGASRKLDSITAKLFWEKIMKSQKEGDVK